MDGVNFADYADALITRFSNPYLYHQTYQIAMDGTEKLPLRILAPALDALEAGQPMAPFAFAVAAWMRYTLGRTEAGETYALRDPREDELTRLTREQENEEVVANLVALPGLFPSTLAKDSGFPQMVSTRLGIMMHQGMRRALDAE
jgi:fructuronate reductase